MRELACLNGVTTPPVEAKISIWDRGFLFGDAVYEVMRVYKGRCWLERSHMDRLARSLREIEIEGYDLDRLLDRALETLRRSEILEGTVYMHVTRGVSPRKHVYPDPPVEPTELIVVRPYDDAPTQALRQKGVSAFSQPDLRWGRCDVKSTNLLANVMALQAVHRKGGSEAILVDDQGFITEATHSSLVWVKDGKLRGTAETEAILPGTSRRHLIDIAKSLSIRFETAAIRLEDLVRMDEVMLTGTTIEVMPVVSIDQTPIGGGAPGPLSLELQSEFRRSVEAWLASN